MARWGGEFRSARSGRINMSPLSEGRRDMRRDGPGPQCISSHVPRVDEGEGEDVRELASFAPTVRRSDPTMATHT